MEQKTSKEPKQENKVDTKPEQVQSVASTKVSEGKAEQSKETAEQLKHQIDSLKKELTDKQKLIDDYSDHLKRLQAEFENYSKRVEKEKKDFQIFAAQKLILELLVIVDEFRFALLNFDKNKIPKEFYDGVQMIFDNLHKMLEKEGVKEIEAKGKAFNPYEHEAIMQSHIDTLPDNIVVEELQKGYLLKDKVLRYAKVSINKLFFEKEKFTKETKK